MTISRGSIVVALTAVSATLLSVETAQATHFRHGHMHWTQRPDLGPNTAEFTLIASFRRSGYGGSAGDGFPQTGDIITEGIGGTGISFGDGSPSTGTLQFEVIAYSPGEDWIVGSAITSSKGPASGVSIPESESNDSAGTANGPIAVGDDYTGTISPSADSDYVALTVTGADCIQAKTVLGSLGDSTLTLYDVDGVSQLAFNDDFGSLASRVDYCFPGAGTYYYAVRSYAGSGTGTYTLQVRSLVTGSVIHSYAAPTNGGVPWLASVDGCCRISTLRNCADCSYRIETEVRFDITNSSPVSSLPPIVNVPINSVFSFFVPAVDAQGDTRSWRFSTSVESGISNPIGPDGGADATNAPSINAATGEVTWDTTGGTAIGDLFTMSVRIEESRMGSPIGSSTIDFILRIVDAVANDPPSCDIMPPGPFLALEGDSISFTVTGTDPNSGDVITLNTAGLPPGATMMPPLPLAGPDTGVASTFNWDTQVGDAGAYVVSFTVTDQGGLQSLCNASIAVKPAAVVPAVSEWGLLVLTLVGLIVGTTMFGRRKASIAG